MKELNNIIQSCTIEIQEDELSEIVDDAIQEFIEKETSLDRLKKNLLTSQTNVYINNI